MLVAVAVLGLLLGAAARLIVVYLPRIEDENSKAGLSAKPARRLLEAVPVAGARLQARDLAATPGGGYALVAIDLSVTVLVMLKYLGGGMGIAFVASALFITFLVAILFIDWHHHLIFPLMIYPAAALAVISSLLGGVPSLGQSLLGGAVGAGFFFFMYWLARVMYRKEALGFGDVLLAGLIGLILGYPKVMGALIIGSLVAGLAGLVFIAIGRKSRSDYIPFGAYLSGATLALLVFQASLWHILPFQLLADLIALAAAIVQASLKG